MLAVSLSLLGLHRGRCKGRVWKNAWSLFEGLDFLAVQSSYENQVPDIDDLT